MRLAINLPALLPDRYLTGTVGPWSTQVELLKAQLSAAAADHEALLQEREREWREQAAGAVVEAEAEADRRVREAMGAWSSMRR